MFEEINVKDFLERDIENEENFQSYKVFIEEIKNKLEELSKNDKINYKLHIIDKINLYISHSYKSDGCELDEIKEIDKWLC